MVSFAPLDPAILSPLLQDSQTQLNVWLWVCIYFQQLMDEVSLISVLETLLEESIYLGIRELNVKLETLNC